MHYMLAMTDLFDPIKLREAADLTRKQAAELWEVAETTVFRWEQGPDKMKRWQVHLYLSLEPKAAVAE